MIRRSTIITLSLAGFITAGVFAAQAAPKQVGPGVTWYNEVRAQGPLNYNVVKVDLKNPLVSIESESGKDQLFLGERVLDGAKREATQTNVEIIAGVNADFWASDKKLYTPVGMLVADGMIYNMPSPKRRVFAMTKDRVPYIGRVSLKVSLSNGRQRIKIDAINPTTDAGDVRLFTQPFGKSVPAGKGKRYVIKLATNEFLPNQAVAVELNPAASGAATPLELGTMVLDISPGKAGQFQLNPGKFTLQAEMPEIKGVVTSVTGGGPSLVTNGLAKVATDEGTGSSFSTTKHPRTAIGFSQDGKNVYLVTVDGRQPKISIGSSLDELAKYMQSLGCWQAINLDGGGSTTMVVNDEVVNKPSDFKGPRIVANALFVVSPKSDGIPKQLSVSGPGMDKGRLIAPAGAKVEVDVSALDARGIPLKVNNSTPVTAGGQILKGTAAGTGNKLTLELGDAPGDGNVTIQMGNAQGILPVHAVAVTRIVVNPPVLVMDSKESMDLEVRAFAGNEEIALEPEMFSLSSSVQGLVAVSGDKITAGDQAGRGNVAVQVGAAKVDIPVFVGQSLPTTVESFDGAMPALEFQKFDATKTRLSTEGTNKKVGAGAGKLDYTMEKGGAARVSLMLNKRMDKAPAKLGIWVYGDGFEEWVRSTLVDANGREFLADFTNGGDGITWKDDWKYLSIPFSAVSPAKGSSQETPKFPVVIRDLYVAQDQEVLKKSGSILLDQYQAVYPPN